jgi:hypothetical protein
VAITTTELIEALQAAGHRAELVKDSEDPDYPRVNVWGQDGLAGSPAVTLWMPTDNPNEQSFIWGEQFQFGMPGDVTLPALVGHILWTLEDLA